MFVVPGKSKREILTATYVLRSLFNKLDEPYIRVERIIERLDTVDPTFQYQYWDNNAFPKGMEAYYDPATNSMHIPDITYNNAVNGEGRARFTLAHELGHYFLGHKAVMARQDQIVPKYCQSEWQANTFASYFIAPPHILYKCANPYAVSTMFGMSKSAAKIAFDNVKKPSA